MDMAEKMVGCPASGKTKARSCRRMRQQAEMEFGRGDRFVSTPSGCGSVRKWSSAVPECFATPPSACGSKRKWI
uniref:Uncharacterized protein n=1 Tax=Oryza glaberrima TaxID=4538 RepID=I1NZR8_ORYGL